jgi:hypothetical protein
MEGNWFNAGLFGKLIGDDDEIEIDIEDKPRPLVSLPGRPLARPPSWGSESSELSRGSPKVEIIRRLRKAAPRQVCDVRRSSRDITSRDIWAMRARRTRRWI